MTESNGASDATGVLRLDLIDDLGRVVDTIYVGEITGTHAAAPPRRTTTDRHGVRRPK